MSERTNEAPPAVLGYLATSTDRLRKVSTRNTIALRLYERLHGTMAFLGVLFLAVVITERLMDPREPMRSILTAVGWGSGRRSQRNSSSDSRSPKRRFIRRYWWQALLLALPFLNAVRALAALRLTRLGRALSAGVRATQTARSRLAGRLGWLASLTVIIVVVSADVLYQFADYPA